MPNLTKLLCKFIKQKSPGCEFTSIQCNRDYSARFHRDKNNWGPSMIIGLGDYEDGGELFIAFEGQEHFDCNHQITLQDEKVPSGYKTGQVVEGKLLDIHNQWEEFDGRIGHMAQAFQKGTRISLVFFTRREAFDRLPADVEQVLKDHGVPVPSEKWFMETKEPPLRPQKQGRTERAPNQWTRPEDPQIPDSDDEVEDGSAVFEGQPIKDLECFQDEMKVDWRSLEVPLKVASCNAGLAAMMALQELFPEGKVEASVVQEGLLSDAMSKFAKNVGAAQSFKDYKVLSGASSTCHVKCKKEEKLKNEDIFHGCFQIWDLMPYFLEESETSLHLTGLKDDTKESAKAFRAIEEHLRQQQPPLALLELPDWEKWPSQQPRAMKFLRNRLLCNDSYHSKCVILPLPEPLSGSRFHIFLARKEVMKEEQLKQTVQLAKHLLLKLPQRRVQDLLLDEKKDPPQPPGGGFVKADGIYKDYLAQKHQGHWLLSDQHSKCLKRLNQVCKQAKATEVDWKTCFVDLGEEQIWSDNGLLPNACSAWHYSLSKDRLLRGSEEMLLRGFPCDPELGLAMGRGTLSDKELRRIAAAGSSLPLLGACLAALLATSDLTPISPALGALRASLLPELPAVEEILEADEEQSEIRNRAVACYSLLQRLEQKSDRNKDKGKKTTLPKELQTALQERGQEIQDQDDPAKEPDSLLRSPGEVHDWEDRQRKLNHFELQFPCLPFGDAMRWTYQAATMANEEQRTVAAKIIKAGLNYMNQCVLLVIHQDFKTRKHAKLMDKNLTNMEQFRAQFINDLPRRLRGLDETQQDFVNFKNRSFVCQFLAGHNKTRLGRLTSESMQHYVEEVMVPVLGAKIPRANWMLLDHLSARWPEIQKLPEVKEALDMSEGFQRLSAILGEVAEGVSKMAKTQKRELRDEATKWLSTFSNEPQLKKRPDFLRAVLLLAFVLQEVLKDKTLFPKLQAETIAVCLEQLSSSNLQETNSFLTKFSEPTESGIVLWLGRRLQFTAKLLSQLDQTKDQAKSRSVDQLNESLQTLRSATFDRDRLHETHTAEVTNWRALTQEEDEKLALAEQELTQALEEAKERLQKEKEAEELIRKKESLQRCQQEARKNFDKLQLFMEDGPGPGGEPTVRLKFPYNDGSKDVVEVECEIVKQLANTMQACKASQELLQKHSSALSESDEQILQRAKSAVYQWSELPAIKHWRKSCLLEKDVPLCLAELLDKVGLLQKLPELTQSLLDNRLPNLPKGVTAKLLQGVKDDQFAEKLKHRLPPDVGKTTSKSCGLDYYYVNDKDSDRKLQSPWKWPLPLPLSERNPWPEEPEGFWRHEEDHAKYVTVVDKWCFLCAQKCRDQHLESEHHRRSLLQWEKACKILAQLIDDMENVDETCTYQPQLSQDLLKLWRFEALTRLRACEDWQVFSSFWHLILEEWEERSGSAEGLKKWLKDQLAVAQLEEPELLWHPSPPRPGEHFPLFPKTSLDLTNLPEQLQAMDLLSQGLLLKPDNRVYCAFCEMYLQDSSDCGRRNHLKVKERNEAKKHLKYKQNWEHYVQKLKDGWKFEATGMHLDGKRYRCKCGKEGEWADGGLDHVEEKKHKDYLRTQHVPVTEAVTKKWKKRWEQSFKENCERYLERLEQEELRKWEEFAPAPDVPMGDAPTLSSSRSHPEPDLPQPGRDFPDLSSGNMFVDGKCVCCSVDVSSEKQKQHSETPQHVAYRDASLKAFKIIQNRGDRLWRDGISLQDGKVKCQCQKEVEWWNIGMWFGKQPHVATNQHIRKWARWNTVPETLPWEAGRRERWLASFSVRPPPDPVPVPEASASRERPATPEPKRRRVEADVPEPQTEPPEGSQQHRGMSSSSSPAKSMSKAQEYALPTPEEIKQSTELCANRHFPELDQPLVWGWCRFGDKKYKTKEGWIYCTVCRSFVAVVKWDGGHTYTLSQEPAEQGSCCHFDGQWTWSNVLQKYSEKKR